MKINKSEVDKMIKEEFQKMMEKKKLSSRLSQINEELAKMDSEDSILNEVEAGGETKVSSHAWTGKEDGDVKFKPEFEKIGTHLKEEEDAAEEISVDATGAETMGEFEAKFAEIGRAIDAKLAGEAGEEAGAEEVGNVEASDEDFEEVEVEPETGNAEAGNVEGEEEIDEYKEIVGGVGAEEGMTADQAVKKESVEEPIEGESVAQEAPADTVNDNMEKDTHVKEGVEKQSTVLAEGKTTEKKNIFTEGLDDTKKSKLLSEMQRMKKFAGLTKDEE